MIKINNVTIPSPSSLNVSVQDINKAERNTNGTMIIERIATKRKVELQFAHLTRVELSTLLQSITSTFFTVEYPDPQTNALNTITCYVGDRKTEMIMYKDGVPYWKNVTFNFIEQ